MLSGTINASLLDNEAEAGFVNGPGPSDSSKDDAVTITTLGRESEGEAARTRSVSYVADPDALDTPASEGGCADVAKFGKSFWLLTFCCVVV